MTRKPGGDWQWILIVAALPLLVSGAMFHAPIALMAVLGATYLVRDHRSLRNDPGARFIVWIFLCLWVPQLIALPDAASPGRSLTMAAVYLMYPLAAVFMLRGLGPGRQWIHFAAGAAAIVCIWALDVIPGATGLVEWPVQRADPRYIPGALFSRFLVGHVAAVVSPLVFELVRRQSRAHRWVWVLPVVLTALVFLSGRRVAWVMLLISAATYLVYLVRLKRPEPRRVALAVLFPTVVAVLVYLGNGETRNRVNLTAGLFSTDVETIDVALSWRLDIWKTGFAVAESNWANGVGARGFRGVYADYAADDDFWLQGHLDGAYHPHLFALEVAAETGVPGLLGYGLALWLLWSVLLRSRPGGDDWLWPCGIAAIVATLPLNAHAAFYGAYWSTVIWWLIGLVAAAMSQRSAPSVAFAPSTRSDSDRLAQQPPGS